MPTLRLLPLVLLAACGLSPQTKDSSTDTDDTDGGGGGGGGGDTLTIKDIRSGAAADGDAVTLTGVVVTSPLTRDGSGFFVEDPDGGEYSGLYVWSQAGFTTAPAQEGDTVTINGSISEYYDWTELAVSDPSSVEVTDAGGDVPAPADLGDGSGVDWDAYESVLVTLTNQTITGVDEYNTAAISAGINFDDGFQYNEFDCGGSYTSMTGIIFYSYSAWSLNNRTDDDLVGYTAGTPMDATIADLRSGTVCGAVNLHDVIVTGGNFDDTDTTFFVQDEGGGPNSGIAVYVKGTSMDVAVGDKLDIAGSLTDYYGLAELSVAASTDIVAKGTGTPVATELTAAPSDWTPYQSALVTLTDVTTDAGDDYGQLSTNYGIYIDDVYTSTDAWASSSFSSVTGPLYFTSYDDVDEWKVEPRTDADVVK